MWNAGPVVQPGTAIGYNGSSRLAEFHNTAVDAVRSAYRKRPFPFLGYRRVGDTQSTVLFRTQQEASAWYQAQKPDYSYAAFFDAKDLSTPLGERFSQVTHDKYVWTAPRVGTLLNQARAWVPIDSLQVLNEADAPLDFAVEAMYQQLGRVAGYVPVEGSFNRVRAVKQQHPEWVSYFEDVAAPFYASYMAFKRRHSELTPLQRPAHALGKNWRERLRVVRENAEQLGMTREAARQPQSSVGAEAPLPAKIVFDDRQRLHATIYLDGRRYTTSINLAPTITTMLNGFARAHAALPPHDQPPIQVSGEIVVEAIERAVSAAGDALITKLVDRHGRAGTPFGGGNGASRS